MIVKSRKNIVTVLVFYACIALLLWLSIENIINLGFSLSTIFLCLLTLLLSGTLLWIIFGTYYKITSTDVHYHFGPIKGKLEINNIKEITANTTLWAGFKPALDFKGIIIKYNKYDEIYFSPKDNTAFINHLLKINPEIKVL